MADQKISELDSLSGFSMSKSDEFAVVDVSANQTKKLDGQGLLDFFNDQTVVNFKDTIRLADDDNAAVSETNHGCQIDGTDSTIKISEEDTATRIPIAFYNPNGRVGTITINGSTTSYNTSSDYRLKENEVSLTNACDILSQLPVYTFNFKKDPSTTMRGFFAHELADAIPEAVLGTKDEVDENGDPVYQSVDHSKIVPLLVAAIKELKSEVDSLKTSIINLEANIVVP